MLTPNHRFRLGNRVWDSVRTRSRMRKECTLLIDKFNQLYVTVYSYNDLETLRLIRMIQERLQSLEDDTRSVASYDAP